MKIALAQINPTVGALRANAETIAAQARAAAAAGCELAVFPELAICGYPPRDLAEKPDFVAGCRHWLAWASRQAPEITILAGCLMPASARTGKRVHNAALGLQNGAEIFVQAKMLLPTYDVFDDARNFAPAEAQTLWHWRGRRLAVTICEDAWNDKNYWPRRNARLLYARDPVAEQMAAGAELLLNLSASPFTRGKLELRREMLAAIAEAYRVPVLFCNQIGGNDQLIFDGTSLVFGPGGELRQQARSFQPDLLIVDPDSGAGARANESTTGAADAVAAMRQALVLGLRDYVHKCGFRSGVVGLSGGIDSAVTAALAVEALGASQLVGLALPSRYSSPGSLADARALARNLGIELREISIEPGLEAALAALAPAWQAMPHQDPKGLTEQNLQSRLRGLYLMAVSNRTGALVLSTGNKSELATGYCTLYGDMAGGLAVLGDVLKTQVYALARHINQQREIIPAGTLTKPPSAELRPDQTDQDDLPPYEVVDAVIAGYVEDYKTGEQIARELRLPLNQVRDLIRRIDRSEYKRQQAAPCLKISPKAFGMGRRFPIAQQYEETVAPAAVETGTMTEAGKVQA